MNTAFCKDCSGFRQFSSSKTLLHTAARYHRDVYLGHRTEVFEGDVREKPQTLHLAVQEGASMKFNFTEDQSTAIRSGIIALVTVGDKYPEATATWKNYCRQSVVLQQMLDDASLAIDTAKGK